MNMILHNIKVAVRNLMKYKLQTAISVLSIAVGIVTFSLTHSMMSRYRLPSIFDQSYSDRVYEMSFKMINDEKTTYVSDELIRALNGNGGLQNVEKLAVPNDLATALYKSKFQLADSTVRTGFIAAGVIDPELPDFIGIQSSISGKKIPKLKAGEAIISETLAKRIFGDINPIGAKVELVSLSSNPHIIADVYQTTSFADPLLFSDFLYYCNSNEITDGFGEDSPYSKCVEIVLKQSSTEKNFLKEVNDRLLPLGIKAEISRIADKYDFKKIIPIKMIVYAIGSLILLAAIIGFLRIEIQLFRLRKHEIALRIVNGAKLRQVFGCLFTEVTLTICIAVMLALILGILLQDFMNEILKLQMDSSFISDLLQDSNLIPYSIITGMVLIIVCSLTAWYMILRISKEQQGLETSIRRKNNHVFHNVMLGIQIIICLVFVCSTFILMKGGDLVMKVCNVPDNDRHYMECLYIEFNKVSQREQLKEAIERLPDLEKLISYQKGMTVITDVVLNPKLSEQLNGHVGYNCYFTIDTTFLSFLGIDVEWLSNDINSNRFMLIGDKAFNRFKDIGLMENNTLSIGLNGEHIQVAGIIKRFPYDMNGENIIVIDSEHQDSYMNVILVPQNGKGKNLLKSVEETIKDIEPELMTKIIYRYREWENSLPLIVEAARTCGLILGGMSIIICAMSILSSIALDTRARRKEVAIRKVNGAKSKDIYRMFGRIYTLLIAISLAIAIPVCLMINKWVENYVNESIPESIHLSPILPIILGSSIVILLIYIIVGWHIYKVIRVNPAKIIAKE